MPEFEKLIVSDIDGTMLGNDESLERFARWLDSHDEVGLSYASGRFYESVLESIEQTPLPAPAAVIGGVGSDINLHPSGELLQQWHEILDENWDAKKVREVLSAHDELEIQPEKWQSDYKVSYYLYDADKEHLLKLQDELARASIETRVIYSSSRDLDFLPKKADKGAAAEFLAGQWGIDKDNVLVCGDSGNDEMLFKRGFNGVAVGNSKPELAALEAPNIYHAQAEYAAGVMEGIKHWWNLDG